jgi:hypothetical protein
MVLLLTDWVAFYRCFVILLKYQYSQMNVRLPGGSTVDTAMFFGDRGAPNPANHCMNWLLFMVKELLSIRLQKISTSVGLSHAGSCWQSIPFARQGYFDDGQFAIAACLLFLLIESLLELVNLVGVGLSYTKMVVSFQNDTKQSVDIAAACADAWKA